MLFFFPFIFSCFGGIQFGDILVETKTNKTSLFVVSAEAVSPSQVRITFSESLNPDTASATESYSIDDLEIFLAVFDPDNPTIVELTTAQQISQKYRVYVSSIYSAYGNPIEDPNYADFSGYEVGLDTICPQVVSAQAIHRNLIRIAFSELMDPVTVTNRSNYMIPGLTINSVVNRSNPLVVDIYTTDQSVLDYLVFGDIRDLAGNVLCDTSKTIEVRGTIIEDTDAPYITSISAINEGTVQLQFSEPIKKNHLLDINNYSIPGLTLTAIVLVDSSNTLVHISTSPQSDVDYTCTVTNVEDNADNVIGTPNSGLFHGSNKEPSPPTLLSAESVNPQLVRAYFSSAMNESSAENLANYAIDGLSISSATRLSSNYSIVELNTNTQSFIQYTLTARNIEDTNNIMMDTTSVAFQGEYQLCIESVEPQSDVLLYLMFNRAVTSPTAVDTANYTIDTNGNPPAGGITVSSVQIDSLDHRKVILTTTPHLGYSYTLNIQHVEDENYFPIGSTPASCNQVDYIGESVDSAPPKISSITTIDNVSIRITFDEPVDGPTAETIGNYSITPALSITSATRNALDHRIVTLGTSPQSDITYTLTVINVEDLSSNAIPVSGESDTFVGKAAVTVEEIYASDKTHVLVLFTDDVALPSAEVISNYDIPGLTISSVKRSDFSNRLVQLTTTTQTNGSPYTCTVSTNVMDLTGDAIGVPNDATFTGTNIAIGINASWIGGGSDGWKTTDGTVESNDQRSFSNPEGLVCLNNYLYVVDSSNHRICKWDINGNNIGWVGDTHTAGFAGGKGAGLGSSTGSFLLPSDIDSTTTGYLLTVDYGNHRIQKWDTNGNSLGWIGRMHTTGWATGPGATMGSGDGELRNPKGITVTTDGYFYVSDCANCRIQKWDTDGNYIGWIGKGHTTGWGTGIAPGIGDGDGEFNSPMGICTDLNGNLLIADYYNHRIQKWTADGVYIGWIGTGHADGWNTGPAPSQGNGDGQFEFPVGVEVDHAGNIYVGERYGAKVQKWSKHAIYLGWIGTGHTSGFEPGGSSSIGSATGEFNTRIQEGIFISPDGYLYVADSLNYRIQRFE